jgi:hypothetical protein
MQSIYNFKASEKGSEMDFVLLFASKEIAEKQMKSCRKNSI